MTEQKNEQRLIKAREHWMEIHREYNVVARIPYDYLNREDDGTLAEAKLRINGDKYIKFKEYALKNNLDITTILETMYGLILQEYTYERDAIIGSSTSITPVRIKTNENERFTKKVKKVMKQKKNSKEYMNYLLSEIEKGSPLSKKLVNTIIISENVESYAQDLIENIMIHKGYDFGLITAAGEGTLRLEARYNPFRYKHRTAERVLKMFETIINQIVENEEIKLDEIKYITKKEEKKVLNKFNDMGLRKPLDSTYMDLFYEQVRKTPDNIALRDNDINITYREIDMLTERFAGYLNSIGIKREDTVASILQRDVWVVIVAIGVMKAGAVIFPIDQGNPSKRMEYLLEDSDAELIVTSKELEDRIPDMNKRKIYIENKSMFENDYPITEVVYPDNCAYKISTSGSTGRPKCMSIEHRSFVNMCRYAVDYISADENDICGVYLSFSFDAAIKQLFPYLLCGASVDVIPEYARTDEYSVNKYCKNRKITILAVPTIFAKRFIKNCENKYLRVLQSGGDKLKGYRKRHYDIYNEYGPAEFTVISTAFKVTKEYEKIPIGKPVYNTYAYILDRNGNLCPVGVPGELCLSGIQISRGYMHRDELTLKSFVPNPRGIDKYTRMMYRTGDLAKWFDSGDIDCIGRMDSQVKINGIRVEIYEIENTMNEIPEIKSSVCVAREDDRGEKYLKAFYVSDNKVEPMKIRNHLKKMLPPYMIPDSIVQISNIPVTPIGKVNKKMLPE